MINQEEYEILKDLFHFIHWEDEEMKKDKDWLSERVGELNSTDAVFNESGVSYIDTAVSMERVFDLIDQLDEPEKPVVSEEVYKHIESKKGDGITLFNSLDHARDTLGDFKVPFPNYKNKQEEYAQAWLAYPNIEVEKEPLYRVLDRNITLLGRINGFMLTTVEILEYYPEYTPTFDFTEQEIKDYNENYWAFAVPVEAQND